MVRAHAAERELMNAAHPTLTPKPLTPVLTRDQYLADRVRTDLRLVTERHGKTREAGLVEAAQVCIKSGLTFSVALQDGTPVGACR